jgi:O-antigen/teichoic acid export membrane protein
MSPNPTETSRRSPAHVAISLLSRSRKWLFKGVIAVMDQGLISGSNFLLGILLARWLGADQYGAYALAFSMFILVSFVHQSLLLEPMTVFGPSVYHGAPRQYLGILVWLQTALAAIVFLVGATAGAFLHARGSTQLTAALAGMTLAAPCVLLFWFARRACYVQFIHIRSLGGAVLYMPLLLGGMWLLLRQELLSPFTAFIAMGLAALLTSFHLLWQLKPALKPENTCYQFREVIRRHWDYGRWALVAGVLLWVPWNIFYPLLTRFSGLAQTATLRAAWNTALPITQTYAAFSLLFLPHTARLGQKEGWQAMKGQAIRISGLFSAGSAVYWVIVCLFRGPLVRFLYAGRYPEIIPLLPWVAVSSIVSGAVMGPTIVMRAMQAPASVCGIYFGASAVALGVGIPVSWAWGVRGAVLSNVLASFAAAFGGFLILRACVRREEAPAACRERVSAPVTSSAGL